MPKIIPIGFALLLLLSLRHSSGNYAAQSKQENSDAATDILQKLIVENGTVTMDLDLNRLNELAFAPQGAVSVVAGKISAGAAMQPVEVTQLVNGEIKSVVMPPLGSANGRETPTLVPGPDVIVGELPEMAQYGNDTVNHLVGLGVGTISCNAGDQPLDWFALSNTDHPVIPQNFYRMSGGATNDDRFEQIGQSWLKHAFTALEGNACTFGCNSSGCTPGTHLCPGCSDPYGSSLNASQNGIGSRAWVNPFTGIFPSTANNHTGHSHTGT